MIDGCEYRNASLLYMRRLKTELRKRFGVCLKH